MAVTLSGTLVVRNVKGRNGVFAVGDLGTEIGRFKVKDNFLEQYEEGEYKGDFLVTQIYPYSYVYGGKVVTEIRANIADVSLAEADERPMPEAPSEPDPALLEAQTSQHAGPSHDDSGAAAVPVLQEGGGPDDPDAVLFGELYPALVAHQMIKLDPTVDRNLFRRQRDRLKTLGGYRFDASTQSWVYTSPQD